MARSLVEQLRSEGAVFYPWKTPGSLADRVGDDETLCRFVTSFATTPEEIDRFGTRITSKAA
jgi:threonine aldolase